MLIKAKIDTLHKIHEIEINENKQNTIYHQTQIYLDYIHFESKENRIFFALFNPESHMFIINYEEILNCTIYLINLYIIFFSFLNY